MLTIANAARTKRLIKHSKLPSTEVQTLTDHQKTPERVRKAPDCSFQFAFGIVENGECQPIRTYAPDFFGHSSYFYWLAYLIFYYSQGEPDNTARRFAYTSSGAANPKESFFFLMSWIE